MLRIAVIAALVGIVVLVLRARSHGRHNAAQPAAVGSLEADRETLSALREAGADLSKPTEVNFYLYFPSQTVAESAAALAATPELTARVRLAADGSAWLCQISGELVPTEAAIHAYSVRFQAIAAAQGGEYDGWEAAVVQ